MENLKGYIITGVVSFVSALLLRNLEPKSKVCYWFPHSFLFDLKNENVVLQTNSITVQNLGRKTAENIEIIHKSKPDFFQCAPSVHFEEIATNTGEHILKIETLGPKEFFTIQILSYKSVPILLNIRSKDGVAQQIQFQIQRNWPKWVQYITLVCMIVGFGFLIYWIIRSIFFLSHSIGI